MQIRDAALEIACFFKWENERGDVEHSARGDIDGRVIGRVGHRVELFADGISLALAKHFVAAVIDEKSRFGVGALDSDIDTTRFGQFVVEFVEVAVENANKFVRQYIPKGMESVLYLTRESHQYRPKSTEYQGKNKF